MEINKKIIGYINIAKKANYLIIGSDTLKNYTKKLYLVLYDKNAQNSVKKIVYDISHKDIKTIEIENLSELVNIENCKIVGLKNKGLSDTILEILDRGEIIDKRTN